MKLISTLFFLLYLSFIGLSQNTFSITGTVTDTLDNPLISSTVLLLDKADSTMVDFNKTEMDGSFKFSNVEAGNYLVKTTYIGFIPLTVDASSPSGENIKLGQMKMDELAEELMAVVIKAAKAPIKMRGDTVEYDATTFKVPEGSTVEDLLKRLPGIEIEQDGSISSEGKDVSKVTVDGKSFFGSDPKTATKNLPAEGISKVQVFDTKTEEEEVVGKTGESTDKTMNLELKEEFKAGSFGRVVAGIGTENTKELKGNINKFNDKIQFSIVGVGNNTGRNGLSWDDYQDFMGSQSWNWGSGTDYGFGRGGRYTIRLGGSGSSIESNIQSIFFNDPQGGYPENYNGGINFNFDNKKTKVSTVYYYSQSGLERIREGDTDKFLQNFTLNESESNAGNDVSRGHRIETELEHEIDSLHTVKVSVNAAYINEDRFSNSTLNLSRDQVLNNSTSFSNDEKTTGYLTNALILFRKKFKKKGRSLGLNASILSTELTDDNIQNSSTNYFDITGMIDSTSTIDQSNLSINDKVQFKANFLYAEPLSKKFTWATFYNYSNRDESGDRDVFDEVQGEQLLNGFLSRTYENNISFNRIGSYIKYAHDGLNITAGTAYQLFDLQGTYNGKGNSNISGTVDKTFQNIIPHAMINYSPSRNAYFGITYSRSATEPSIDDLQPIVDNSNPVYIRSGNIDLLPEISNSLGYNISRTWTLAGIRAYFNGSFDFYENQFSTSQLVDENLVTTSTPINIDGGTGFNSWGGFNFPIIKNKIKARVNMNYRANERPSFVNNIENNTDTKMFNPSIRLNITPTDDIGLFLTAGRRVTNTTFDINTTQNQKTINTSFGLEFNAKVAKNLYFNSNFDYDRYENERFDFDRTVPILNASISKQFLEGNKAEVRLSIYDAFNQNTSVSLSSFGNSNSTSETQSLGRYLMLSLSYNIRGLKSKVQKRGWW